MSIASGTVCGITRDETYYVSQTIETIGGVQYRRVKASGCPGYDWTVCISYFYFALFIYCCYSLVKIQEMQLYKIMTIIFHYNLSIPNK